jgi:hypothetical protein
MAFPTLFDPGVRDRLDPGVRDRRARCDGADGLLAGAVLGTWLNEVSLRGSSELWIAYHQAVTPG